MRVVVQEHKAARLVDDVKERVPREPELDLDRQGIGQKHLARGDHIGGGVDRHRHLEEVGRPGHGGLEDHADADAGDPGQNQHGKGGHGKLDLDAGEEGVVDEQDDGGRQNLLIQRCQRLPADGDDGVHRRVFHHGRGWPFGLGDGADGFHMGHVHEDARHHVKHVVAPHGRPAQAKDVEHEPEGRQHGGRLDDIDQKADHGVAVGHADVAHGNVEDKLHRREQAAHVGLAKDGLKHLVAFAGTPRGQTPLHREILLIP